MQISIARRIATICPPNWWPTSPLGITMDDVRPSESQLVSFVGSIVAGSYLRTISMLTTDRPPPCIHRHSLDNPARPAIQSPACEASTSACRQPRRSPAWFAQSWSRCRSTTPRAVGSGELDRLVARRVVGPPSQANLETQPTVITKTPSLAQYPLSGLHPRDMGRLLEGERLGHFELLEFVGGGGMGAVFRRTDTMLNRTVAVKVLSHEQSSDEETLRRFQNEAQSAARLDHENISRVYYVGEDRGWHYIVFEFIEGANLRDVVEQQGPLPLADAVSYTLQIADALTHASQRDVVHRDIKPSNVLITPEGRAKLVDMGLARLHQVRTRRPTI